MQTVQWSVKAEMQSAICFNALPSPWLLFLYFWWLPD